jgi:hypothetical protein
MRGMDNAEVKIGAKGVDVAALMAEIRADVARKASEGVYTDLRVALAEKTNLDQLKDQDGFFTLYLESLREAVSIDINDFPIVERRRAFSPILVKLKKSIWNLLKFYTYRLWSQQNQVNSMMLALSEELDDRYKRRIEALEARVRELESKRDAKP